MQTFKTVLSIAGSDSIGGAGIQADIRTGTSLGVHVMTVITAVTAQNSNEVRGFEAVSTDMLRRQLDAILADVIPDAVKIGMIPSSVHVEIIAEYIRRFRLGNIVLDPVLTSSSGTELNQPSSLNVLIDSLMPLAMLITPNIPEAERILQIKISNPAERNDACRKLLTDIGCKAVLLKAGHAEGDTLTDVLTVSTDDLKIIEFTHPRIDTMNSHGTGCTLSTAIASFLALGDDLETAVGRGVDYLLNALKAGKNYSLGKLNGPCPLNHFFNYLNQSL